MAVTEINDSGVAAAGAAFDASEPVFMVNLLRYHARARYEGDAFPPCTGREAYFTRYIPAFAEVTAGQGIAAEWVGSAKSVVVGPNGEEWDDVAIVRYPNISAFQRMIGSDAYRERADPHRRAALADWRLIATTRQPLPGADQ